MPRRLRELGALSLAGQATTLSSFVSMAVLARTVGVETFGRVVFAQAVASIVLTIVDVRFDDAVQRFLPQVERADGGASGRSFYRRVLGWDLALGLGVVSISIVAAVTQVLPDGDVADPTFLLLALLAAGAGTAVGTLNAGYAVAGALERMAAVNLALAPASCGVLVTATILSGAVGFLFAQVAMVLVQMTALTVGLRTRVFGAGTPVPTPRGFWPFLLKSSAAGSVSAGTEPGVLALGGALVGPAFTGLLKVAMAPARVVTTLLSPISVQAFPLMARQAARHDLAGVRTSARRLSRVIAPPALGLAVLAAAFMGPAVVLVYGDDFDAAVLPAVLLVLGSLLRGIVVWSKVLPLAVGRAGLRLTVLAVESVVLVTGLVLAWSLSPTDKVLTTYAVVSLTLSLAVSMYWWHLISRLSRAVHSERGPT